MELELRLNCVAWAMLEGYPWWPVYVCDPQKLRVKLFHLGTAHAQILRQTRNFPNDFRIVYFFGSHDFGKMKKILVRPWMGGQRDAYLAGHPKALAAKKGIAEQLAAAIAEAEDYLSMDESTRMLPYMVPSDMDPSIEPPPTPTQEEMEEDGEEEEGDEEGEEEAEPEQPEEDDDISEDDKMLKPKKSKKVKKDDKEDKKKKKKEPKKKEPKAKKESNKDTKKNKPKADDKDDVKEPKKTSPVKRKSSTSSLGENDSQKKPKLDDLESKIESEISHIIQTMSLDELTTRKVRAMLESKLQINLKQHKSLIRDVINRIIAQLDTHVESTPMTFEGVELAIASNGDVKSIVEALTNIKNTLSSEQKQKVAKHITAWRSHSDAAVAAMANSLFDEWKLENPTPSVSVLNEAEVHRLKTLVEDSSSSHDALIKALEKLAELKDMDIIRNTGIVKAIAPLRSHQNEKISSLAVSIRKEWKSLYEEDGAEVLSQLRAMRRELEKDPSEDKELQATHIQHLKKLDSMALSTKHIMETSIGTTVSKLRKCKVPAISALAAKLRSKWKAQLQ